MADSWQKLYADIPKVECIEGCTACCGVIPVSPLEYAKLPEPKRMREVDDPLECQFVQDKGCGVYDKRPFMCRLFGTTTEVQFMTCPLGAKPKVPLTARQVQALFNRYRKLAKVDLSTTVFI
jgi:Fe-S-cluster containining protein